MSTGTSSEPDTAGSAPMTPRRSAARKAVTARAPRLVTAAAARISGSLHAHRRPSPRNRQNCELRPRKEPVAVEQPVEVGFDRFLRQSEARRDFGIRRTVDDAGDHVQLAI